MRSADVKKVVLQSSAAGVNRMIFLDARRWWGFQIRLQQVIALHVVIIFISVLNYQKLKRCVWCCFRRNGLQLWSCLSFLKLKRYIQVNAHRTPTGFFTRVLSAGNTHKRVCTCKRSLSPWKQSGVIKIVSVVAPSQFSFWGHGTSRCPRVPSRRRNVFRQWGGGASTHCWAESRKSHSMQNTSAMSCVWVCEWVFGRKQEAAVGQDMLEVTCILQRHARQQMHIFTVHFCISDEFLWVASFSSSYI